MNEQLREIGRNAELAAARAEGRLEVWREIAAMERQVCQCPIWTKRPDLHWEGCIYRRAVEATREPERR